MNKDLSDEGQKRRADSALIVGVGLILFALVVIFALTMKNGILGPFLVGIVSCALATALVVWIGHSFFQRKINVFVAHAEQDAHTVKEIVEDLKQLGVVATTTSSAAQDTDKPSSFEDAISKSDFFLLALSGSTVSNKEVQRECEFALSKKKGGFPVVLQRNPSFEPWLKKTKAFYLEEDRSDLVEQLSQELVNSLRKEKSTSIPMSWIAEVLKRPVQQPT